MTSRREYLGAAALTGVVAVSGCTSILAEEQELTGPSIEQDDPANYYRWEYDGDKLLETGLLRRDDAPGIDRLDVDLVQPQDTTIEHMNFRIRRKPGADGMLSVYFKPPYTEGWEDYQFYREGPCLSARKQVVEAL